MFEESIGQGEVTNLLETEEQPPIQWKDLKVAVFGASSNEDEMAIKNSAAVGQLLAEGGFDAINGGYDQGGMGAMAQAYASTCREHGVPETEIPSHLSGFISTKRFGERTPISSATIVEHEGIPDRLQNLISSADAYIATEGGPGTLEEIRTALQTEKEKGLATSSQQKPIIVIDSNHMALRHLLNTDYEELKDIPADRFFILSGKTLEPRAPGQNVSELATVPDSLPENDSMAEKLKLILNYYYLKNSSDQDSENTEEMKSIEAKIFDPHSDLQVLTLENIFKSDRQ